MRRVSALFIVAACIVQVVSLKIEGCFKKFYLSEGICKPCPSHCERCTNLTQCALCQIGFYGQICENTCESGCTGTCHKEYGHCTDGCPDGDYPDENSPACLKCSNTCRVCSSLASCAACHTGFYGKACEKRCAQLCAGGLCDKRDGTCFDCVDGSYMLNRECMSCPHGCAKCNDSDTCTACKDGFIGPLNGKCLLKCATINMNKVNSVCSMAVCQTLPGHWKLPSTECHHAMKSPSKDCYTEGSCVTVNISLSSIERTERTEHDDLIDSLVYKTFNCSLVCRENATQDLTEPCEGHFREDKCELEELIYNSEIGRANEYRKVGTKSTETWVSSYCKLETLQNSTDSWSTTIIIVTIVIAIVIAIVFAALIYKKSLKEKAKSNEKATPSKENRLSSPEEGDPERSLSQETLGTDCADCALSITSSKNNSSHQNSPLIPTSETLNECYSDSQTQSCLPVSQATPTSAAEDKALKQDSKHLVKRSYTSKKAVISADTIPGKEKRVDDLIKSFEKRNV